MHTPLKLEIALFCTGEYTISDTLWQGQHEPLARLVPLQRKVKIVHQGPWDTAAAGGALVIRAGIQDQLALGSETAEVLTEQTIHRLIEAHDVERRLDGAVLDPKSGKPGHARHATGRAVRIVK